MEHVTGEQDMPLKQDHIIGHVAIGCRWEATLVPDEDQAKDREADIDLEVFNEAVDGFVTCVLEFVQLVC